MHVYYFHFLYCGQAWKDRPIIVLIYMTVISLASPVGGVCENALGDANCGARLAVADHCHLTQADRCGCLKDCQVLSDCGAYSTVH